MQVVPVSSSPYQSMTQVLTVDGKQLTLQLTYYYAEMAGYWVMSVSDAQGNLLLSSIPLVTGTYPAANILAPYAYLGIGSAYVVNTGNSATDLPNASNLGSDYQLWWGDTSA